MRLKRAFVLRDSHSNGPVGMDFLLVRWLFGAPDRFTCAGARSIGGSVNSVEHFLIDCFARLRFF